MFESLTTDADVLSHVTGSLAMLGAGLGWLVMFVRAVRY